MIIEETEGIGWSKLFIVGIIIGSFLTSFFSEEFSIVRVNIKTLIKSIIGSFLMGLGAVWASGCLIGNGLVGTAQFSVKSWYALFFIAIGIWLASYIFLVRPVKKVEK